MTSNEALLYLQLEIEPHLGKIEKVIARYHLPLSKLTLIARDPNHDGKIIVVSNEDQAGLEHACRLAPSQSKVEYSES